MKIFIASDHAGHKEKKALVEVLKAQPSQAEIIDLGTDSEQSVHYPDFASALCKKMALGPLKESKGILICGSGIGMCMVANRYQGIRAALCRDEEEARLSREHNDANVLCLGARTTPLETMKKILEVWLKTPAGSGRHAERVALFSDLGEPLKED